MRYTELAFLFLIFAEASLVRGHFFSVLYSNPHGEVTPKLTWPWKVLFEDTAEDSHHVRLKSEDFQESQSSLHHDNSNAGCILAKINMTFLFPDGSSEIDVPESSTVSGSCFREKQVLILAWNNSQNTLALTFAKKGNVTLDYVEGSLEISGVMTKVKSREGLNLMQTPFRYCYVCQDPISLNLTSSSGGKAITLRFNDIRVEAFRYNPFAESFTHLVWNCRYYWIIRYVPLIVGSALAFLVFVMVLTFIFRKKLGF